MKLDCSIFINRITIKVKVLKHGKKILKIIEICIIKYCAYGKINLDCFLIKM